MDGLAAGAGKAVRSAHMSRVQLDVSVKGFTDQHGYTEYVISTTYRSQQYTVPQRYSAFAELHEQLASKYEALTWAFPVPKALFVHDGVKRDRVMKLQDYLHRVLEAMNGAAPPREVMEFLGVPPALGLHSGKYA